MAAKNIKIFIASAGEVKAEREKAILLLNDLRKAHRHLDLEAVEWEYDTVPGSQPGFETVQDAINPKLEQSHIAVFIFYSRIGHYTKVEFDLAQQLGKKFFVLFREGFSPSNEDEIEAFKVLIQFKNGLNKTVVHEQYDGEEGFSHRLYRCLNLYLSETHPSGEINRQLSDQNNALIQLLEEKRLEVEQLRTQLPTPEANEQIIQLNEKIARIEAQLLQSEELRQQQAADKAALEQQLVGQRESDQFKAQALEAVEKGDYIEAENLLQESAKDRIAATASTFYELAKIKNLQLQYREAFDYYELAAKIEPNDSLYLNDAGRMANQLGYADKAIAYYEKSLPLAIAEYGEWHPNIATGYNNLGLAYDSKGEYARAIAFYEQGLAIGKEFYGERHPDIATWHNNLGGAYYSTGEYELAIGYYEKALDVDKEFYGDRHPNTAIDYGNLGSAYRSKGEYDRAISYCEQALVISKEFYGERHPDIATGYNNLGFAYKGKGEYDRAIGYYEKALDIDKEFYGERHPSIAVGYNNLGSAYRSKGEYDRAIGHYEKALAIGKEFYWEQHPDVASSYNNLGSAYRGMGEYARAIMYYEKSLSILVEFLPPQHPNIAITQKNLQAAKDAQAKGGEGK